MWSSFSQCDSLGFDVTIPGVLRACYVLARGFLFPSEAYWVKVDETKDSLRTKPHHELDAEYSELPSLSQGDVWLIKKSSRASGFEPPLPAIVHGKQFIFIMTDLQKIIIESGRCVINDLVERQEVRRLHASNHTRPLLCTELTNGSKVPRFYFPRPKVSKVHFAGNSTIQMWRQGVRINLWNAARVSLVHSDHVIRIRSSIKSSGTHSLHHRLRHRGEL